MPEDGKQLGPDGGRGGGGGGGGGGGVEVEVEVVVGGGGGVVVVVVVVGTHVLCKYEQKYFNMTSIKTPQCNIPLFFYFL